MNTRGTKAIAEKWVTRLDDNSSQHIQDEMNNEAVGEVESCGTWVYIFEDGSSIYEKRRGDWYTGNEYVRCPSCDEWREGDETVDCADCARA